jgi:hypothetical protein
LNPLECGCGTFSSTPCGRATQNIPAFSKILWNGCDKKVKWNMKLIYVFEAALKAYVATIFLLSAIAPAHTMAQAVVLAGNYDGVNYYNGATAIIGQQDTYCFEIGAEFAVAGSGSFDLTQVTIPLVSSAAINGTSNLAGFQVSIVSDNGGQPTGNVISSFAPLEVGTTGANLTYDINGVVQGGMNYWILCSPIVPDNGTLAWFLAYSTIYPGIGNVAERFSSGGLPSGTWAISSGWGSVQPAFSIQGVAIPEPEHYVLFGAVLAVLMAIGRQSSSKRMGQGSVADSFQ